MGSDGASGHGLNPAQERAATTLEGPLLVIAGAGTGKTRTLVHRLARLVEAGVPAEQILLLTFTRRAADEMTVRASELLGGRCRVAGGTFHSFAYLMLRRFGSAVGLARDFTVLDQSDVFDTLGNIRTEMHDSGEAVGLPRRETLAQICSKMVNRQTTLGTVLEEEFQQFQGIEEPLAALLRTYAAYKEARQLLDFDDLLVRLLELLEADSEVRRRVSESYRYVMVDEYQDTNQLQAEIVRALAHSHRNIMVVGDDAQSIYAFRGACHRNLFEFRELFDNVRLITLEENYRSTQPVLEVSNALMRQMSEAFRKQLFTKRKGGERPLLVQVWDEEEQARWVVERLQRLHRDGIPFGEMAVLFRAGFHAFPVEMELGRAGIDFVKYGGFKFTETSHIKDVMAFLRVLHNPRDDLSLGRVLQLLPGVGKTTARRLCAKAAASGVCAGLREGATGRNRAGIAEFADFLEQLDQRDGKPVERLQEVVAFYRPMLESKHDDWPKRQRDLDQLVTMCGRYESLESMLSALTIEPPSSSGRGRRLAARDDAGGDQLVLSTMHSAKGLEWRVVVVIQACDGTIPMGVGNQWDSFVDPERLDEERRLLYVALTRAKDRLYVTFPRMSARGGRQDLSRFLDCMPPELFRVERSRSRY